MKVKDGGGGGSQDRGYAQGEAGTHGRCDQANSFQHPLLTLVTGKRRPTEAPHRNRQDQAAHLLRAASTDCLIRGTSR